MESINNPTPPPQLSILEKDARARTGRFPGHQEKVHPFDMPIEPSELKKFEYNSLLAEARDKILDDDFVEKLVRAIIEKSSSNVSVEKLAQIENSLIENCIHLSDNDIDNLVEQLNKKTLKIVAENKHSLPISPKTSQVIYSMKWHPHSISIKSVVHFIQERSKSLAGKPNQHFSLGFSDRLDAHRKIDIIEAIFGEMDSEIEQLNLIQIKSSMPSEEEISKTTDEHSRYVMDDMMRLGDVEYLELPKEKDRQMYEETLQNREIMREKFFDICTKYESVNQQSLIELLGLGNLNDLQKAWIFSSHIKGIEKQIEQMCLDGYIDEKHKNMLIQDMESLYRSLVKKAGVPMRRVKINVINSLVSVGPNAINHVEIYNSMKSPGGPILAAIS